MTRLEKIISNSTFKVACHHANMRKFRHSSKLLYYNLFSTCENSSLPKPTLNDSYLCNPSNKNEIMQNIMSRKGVGDIERVLQLHKECSSVDSEETHKALLLKEMLKIPNQTHPDVIKYGETPHVVRVFGDKMSFTFKPKPFHDIAKSLNILRNDLSNFTGHKSYFFMGQLAELESALVRLFLKKLHQKGFEIISVPDIVPRSAIESCGMETRGMRSQVSFYMAPPPTAFILTLDICLGLKEMSLSACSTVHYTTSISGLPTAHS